MQVSTKLLDDLKSQNRYLVRKIERLEQGIFPTIPFSGVVIYNIK